MAENLITGVSASQGSNCSHLYILKNLIHTFIMALTLLKLLCISLPDIFLKAKIMCLTLRSGTDWALINVYQIKNRHILPLSSERTTGHLSLERERHESYGY